MNLNETHDPALQSWVESAKRSRHRVSDTESSVLPFSGMAIPGANGRSELATKSSRSHTTLRSMS